MSHAFVAKRAAFCSLWLAIAATGASANLPPLPPGDPLAANISAAPLDAESGTVIAWLAANGGWGLGRMQIDFSIEVNDAAPGTPTLPHTERPGSTCPTATPA